MAGLNNELLLKSQPEIQKILSFQNNLDLSVVRFGAYLKAPFFEGFYWAETEESLITLVTVLFPQSLKHSIDATLVDEVTVNLARTIRKFPKTQKAQVEIKDNINNEFRKRSASLVWAGGFEDLCAGKGALPSFVISEFLCAPNEPDASDFRMLDGTEIEEEDGEIVRKRS